MRLPSLTSLALLAACTASAQQFDFGNPRAEAPQIGVAAPQPYESATGYGLLFQQDLSTQEAETGTAGFESAWPWAFGVKLPGGNYRVSVQLRNASEEDQMVTIKAEARRLMVHGLQVPAGKQIETEFTVHIHDDSLASGGKVQLNDREIGHWNWNDRLELEFAAPGVAVDHLTIEPAEGAPTVYLAGDSTVTDQAQEPWAGWGQMMPVFFKEHVAVANYAESGETLKQFRAEHRLQKILEQIQPGDYLLLQFGHNDMKEKGEGIGPFQSYADDLRAFIRAARAKGALPVLVTSMKRRHFDEEGKLKPTLGDYPEAMRQVAEEMQVPLIDLNAMSAQLYYAWGGVDGSTIGFVHYPAGTFPGQDKDLKDDTHFNTYGGYQLARCVVLGIQKQVPGLQDWLRRDIVPFDPARPEPVGEVAIPSSPLGPYMTDPTQTVFGSY
ncbi:MAG: rhamnogalacturonan acetylesterase [Verrucomicrobiota bacterium JB022]|nr:rhamnogalacturonan acetylesterase [Verrucomicrobiota bacterium JB022]